MSDRGWIGAKTQPSWLLYAYDKLRKSVIAHVFGKKKSRYTGIFVGVT